MNCNEIEELFPRYVERDCSESERREIERHMTSCESCRRSLEVFETLERSLTGLKDAIPAWKGAEAEFARRTGIGRRRRFAGFLWNTPSLCGLAIAAAGVVLGVRGGLTLEAMRSLGSQVQILIDAMSGGFSRGVEGIGSYGLATLLSIYLLLIALPLLAFRAAYARLGKR